MSRYWEMYSLKKTLEQLAITIRKCVTIFQEAGYFEQVRKENAQMLALQYYCVILKNCKDESSVGLKYVYKLQIFPEVIKEIKNLIHRFDHKDEYSYSVLKFLKGVHCIDTTKLTHSEILQIGSLKPHNYENDSRSYDGAMKLLEYHKLLSKEINLSGVCDE